MKKVEADALRAERLKKAPKWVKDEIETLERRIRNLETELRKQIERPESRVSVPVDVGGFGATPLYLEEKKPIRFDVGGEDKKLHLDFIEVKLAWDKYDGEGVHVYAGTTLLFEPSASNVAFLRLKKR